MLIGLVFLLYLGSKLGTPELKEEEPAPIFCSEKCVDKDVITSNNNSEYDFIRCECVLKIKSDATNLGAYTTADTEKLYFDSKNLEEISYEEIKSRIKGWV